MVQRFALPSPSICKAIPVALSTSPFVTAPEIAKDLGISTTSAYKLIHKWNAELEAKNYTTISGKVSRRYYYERIYGMNVPADNGEAM